MALTGNQKKLDKNNNNRIDAQDFKILKAEKAKGRGKGLQDEKMKPGKPMKAALGAIALGLGVKKMLDKNKDSVKDLAGMTGIGAAAKIAKKKKEILGKRMGGKIMKARVGRLVPLKKDPTKPISSVSPSAGGKGSGTTSNGNSTKKGDDFLKRRKKLMGIKQVVGKAGRLGAVGAAVAATAVGAKKLMDKIKERKKEKKMKGDVEGSISPYIKKKMGGGLAAATERLKAQGKMGGGMMKKYSIGGDVYGKMADKKLKKYATSKETQLHSKDFDAGVNRAERRAASETMLAYKKNKKSEKKLMGGGMMMKPMGYKSGKSVKVKCKLGRNKPTKLY